MRRAQSSTFSPSGVKLRKREPRLTSSTPICSSSCLTPADSVGWVTPQASAARPKCRSRAKRKEKFELVDQCVRPLRSGVVGSYDYDRTIENLNQSMAIEGLFLINQFSLVPDRKLKVFQMNAPVVPPKAAMEPAANAAPQTPKGRQIDPAALDEVRALLGDRPRRRDLLIEHLHLIQDRYGHLSAAHLAALAHEMKLAQTEVYEVATFYAHFDVVKEGETPPPPVTVRVCDSLSCAMAGAERLLDDAAGEARPGRARRARALHGRVRHARRSAPSATCR